MADAPHPSVALPSVPVSWGELLDKITILEIKRERLDRAEARANVVRELTMLDAVAAGVRDDPATRALMQELRAVNTALWEIEDAIRLEEAAARFGAEFIRLARQVYHRNDERAAIKRRLNERLASGLVEEKSYRDYRAAAA